MVAVLCKYNVEVLKTEIGLLFAGEADDCCSFRMETMWNFSHKVGKCTDRRHGLKSWYRKGLRVFL